uniref:L-2-hydroxyglutarate dehydrogenase, mitochondrial n=1 Tax=Pseudo-nitzschia australis TaxID=44445 RepID=A0A7S4AU58_9STRA
MLASKASAAFHTEVVVIGAGVVGLAVTRALAKAGKEVVLLEKASHICTETSSRNSEVIHAGLYYPPGSAKAKFCVRGRNLLYQYCEERGVTHRNCGKLVVATNKQQLAGGLLSLRDQAFQNGATDVRLLSREDVRILEPDVECFGGLFSPSTGVLDSHSFYLNLLSDCEDDGATVVLRSEVKDIKLVDGKVCLSADDALLSADTIINCSGLHAHEVASKIHQQEIELNRSTSSTTPSWQPPKQYFAKGTYFRLDGKSPFQHLIYPVPEPGGLGIHATIDWSGNGVKFGPDVEWLDPNIRSNDINYDPDASLVKKFVAAIEKYYPTVPRERLTPDYVGVRPKLRHPSIIAKPTDISTPSKNVTFDDFLIVEKNIVKSRIFHLFGIESPGLTSSLGIAEYIKQAMNY